MARGRGGRGMGWDEGVVVIRDDDTSSGWCNTYY